MAIPAAGRRATPAAPLVAPGDVGPRPVAPMGSPGAHRYYLRGRSLCSHEMAGVFGSVCCCLFAPVIHPFCRIRTSVCVRLGNLGAGPSVCPQKELAADCFRIRRLYQPLWNRGWWGGRGWRFGPPPLGGWCGDLKEA